MKVGRFAHAVYLVFLLVLTSLFLSAFLWTCYNSEPTSTTPQPLPQIAVEKPQEEVVEPSHIESVGVPQMDTPVQKEVAREVIEPVAEAEELPPAEQLISYPQFPGLGWDEEVQPVAKEISVPSTPSVPTPPYIFEPMVLTQEEYDLYYGTPYEETQYSDDFWNDFVVVGQDATITYDDGMYYLSLYINDEAVGDIEVEFSGDTRSLNTNELAQYIGSYITDESHQRIFGDGLEYISLEQLNDRDVDATYNEAKFAIYLGFTLNDMPERTVSVTTTSINRREQYSISGAIKLDPAKFAMSSTLSLYAMADYATDFSAINQKLFSLSVSNKVSTLGLGFNFYYSITSTSPYLNPGTWNGFYDFVESSHRLSFGNVGTNVSNKSMGTTSNFGLTFEKNYSYGTEQARGNQFEHRIVLVEPSTVKITINGEEVFSRSFQAGTYRLKDFVFTQGANQIKITTIPDAHPEDEVVEYVDLGYDYRLLGKGDTLYGFGLSVPREVATSKVGTVNIPWLDGEYLSYYLDAFTATYYQQTGLSNTFTLTSELAFSPGVFNGTLNGVLATLVGTTQAQVSLGLDSDNVNPAISTTLSHRYSGKQGSGFGTLSGTLNFSIPGRTSSVSYYTNTSLTLAYSGKMFDALRFSLSANMAYNTSNDYPSWGLTFATGFSPFTGFSLSGSVTASGAASDPLSPTVTAQISGSFSFSPKLSANSSTRLVSGTPFFNGTSTSSVGMSYKATSNDSVNLSLSGFQFDDPLDHSLIGVWSHSGQLSSLTLRHQISDSYQNMTTTLTASTAFAYADGAFAIGKTINESFLLIKPVGDLKHSDISVARSLDSSPSNLIRPFGSGLYNSLSTNATNSVVVFSTGLTEYSTGSSFVFEMTPRSRQSFVAKIDLQPTFTVSAKLLQEDGTPYVQYSSPVYKVELDDQGNEELIRNDLLYLFTDQEGRFILSEVESGTYLFDLQVGDSWYAIRFVVPDIPSDKLGLDRVLLLEDYQVGDPTFDATMVVRDAFTGEQVGNELDAFGTTLATGYDALVTLPVVERIDEETFWTIIFPPFNESDFGFETFDTDGFVTEADYQYDEATFNSLVDVNATDSTAQQVVTAAP